MTFYSEILYSIILV